MRRILDHGLIALLSDFSSSHDFIATSHVYSITQIYSDVKRTVPPSHIIAKKNPCKHFIT